MHLCRRLPVQLMGAVSVTYLSFRRGGMMVDHVALKEPMLIVNVSF